MRTFAMILLCVLLGRDASAKDAGGLFDKPINVVKIPLPADPLNPQAKPMLSCFYFQDFAVKQVDRGEVGAEQLSIVPLAGREHYQCREANADGESLVDAKEWSGYFKGAKGSYIFFDAADGTNGGLGFAVYSAPAAKKIFEDVSMGFHGIAQSPSGIALSYRRAFAAQCSLFADAARCWAKVKQDTGLTQALPPDCAAAYKREQQRTKAVAQEVAQDPTVFYYEAETVLANDRSKISPAPGKLSCLPAN
jgi:hypothetical protein